MERLRELFRQTAFHVLLFCSALTLLSWPFVSFSDVGRLKAMFIFLFITWALIIFLLFLVSRSLAVSSTDEGTEVDKE